GGRCAVRALFGMKSSRALLPCAARGANRGRTADVGAMRAAGRRSRLAAFLVSLSAIVLTQATAYADVLVRNARVHTVTSRGTLEHTDVLVRGATIAAVGANLTALAGVPVVDAAGRDLTPGIFGGLSDIGLTEVSLE